MLPRRALISNGFLCDALPQRDRAFTELRLLKFHLVHDCAPARIICDFVWIRSLNDVSQLSLLVFAKVTLL